MRLKESQCIAWHCPIGIALVLVPLVLTAGLIIPHDESVFLSVLFGVALT
jgi:hypothetical protein